MWEDKSTAINQHNPSIIISSLIQQRNIHVANNGLLVEFSSGYFCMVTGADIYVCKINWTKENFNICY